MSMKCPHCEEETESVTRTGENRYACGECNMVIAHDDLKPHLDGMEVIDKRGGGGSSSSGSSDSSEEIPPPSSGGSSGDSGSSSSSSPPSNSNPQQNTSHSSTNEREKIYQRGTSGLRQIKKERLKNWLANTDGVGNQTEQRILMVFERNESVHKNPHVLYNLLDDELNASASYINTMVQDIFAPEEEHGDLLQSQGYTPWYNRGGGGGSQRQRGGFGGPMNATGNTGFNPGQRGGNQQGGNQQDSQQNQGGSSPGSDAISRDEAQMMMQSALNQANDQGQRGALLSGLSDATDEALREMATNVGGLAGTVHRVVDEALVSYARDNPEWVIENMGLLQKMLGAAEDMPSSDSEQQAQQAEQDSRVDEALQSIGQEGNSTNQSQQPQNRSPPQQNGQTTTQQEPENPNPDLQDEHLEESNFEPDMSNSSPMSASPEQAEKIDESEPEPKPTPGNDAAEEAEKRKEQFESDDSEDESSGDGFDDIFGDMATN